jgi:hypothetical protein
LDSAAAAAAAAAATAVVRIAAVVVRIAAGEMVVGVVGMGSSWLGGFYGGWECRRMGVGW